MMATNNTSASEAPSRRQAVSEAAPSRVVPKPVPQRQQQDPREYQIGQLRRRFSPKESSLPDGVTCLAFTLTPSDPDFPFDLGRGLEVQIKVPASYPKGAPTLSVKHSDMPRGIAINVERGWDQLVSERRGATLLSLTNALDKHLESFLSEKAAETVKMTIFKDTRHLEALQASSEPEPAQEQAPQQAPQHKRPVYIPEETFTKDQIAEAKARRALETRQIESRMGRLPLYQKSSDGVVYTLPLEPKRRTELPPALQAVKSMQLIIPLLYPLQKMRVLLNDVDSEDAETLEEIFAQKAAEQQHMSLMSLINYLTQNLHLLARQTQQQQKALEAVKASETAKSPDRGKQVEGKGAAHAASMGDVKSHIHVIPRPPEWSHGHRAGSESSGSDEDSYDDSEDEEGDGGAALGPSGGLSASAIATQTPEKGTAITFPSVELYGVELLQISLLSISVKCQRCKMANDVGGLSAGVEKGVSCRKCAADMTVTFRPELVHRGSTRAGFLDLAGCTASDLLPSTFTPTCDKCSTPTAQGLVSVRGETTTNVCRECHGRFTFKIPDVRFQTYTLAHPLAAPGAGGPRRRAENLGLRAGEPLPARGACEHYRKSYRWFRFSCCDRVFPCDRCHDADGDHVHEWAARMVCGHCSREQNYRPESCLYCGRSVVGRKGSGFWEGGKGTRDQVLMRRGDKRKYRRIGGDGKAT
ncbi:hypothetical protein MAPG_05370 [Magnaporthiopsis poae ATCC 64411]|uniref:CHY-type domain-containing protein n=1 Tax=Magnaporthiopsis poae (strain ATCC 64411 / 73-15) TaxID=644358 RepID=A0A0C4DZ78_MAGP6|nr:hypothetical protein MAPG_05370 [Magnaporthiopsis poae ATCC 64411]